MAKRLLLTIILAVLFPGVGHIYLGLVKNGIIILVVAIVMGVTIDTGISPFVPDPLDSLFYFVMLGFLIWQIWDAYRNCKKLNAEQTQVTE